MGVPMFRHYSSGVADQGGPRRYEAIFVGYDENRVGWYVRDLKGVFHFSRDVIFDELVPGRISSSRPVSSSVPSPVSSVSPRPIRDRVRTVAGQAFADALIVCNSLWTLHPMPF